MVLFLPFNFEPTIAFFVKMKCNISFKETPNQKKCQNIIEIIPQHLFVIFVFKSFKVGRRVFDGSVNSS